MTKEESISLERTKHFDSQNGIANLSFSFNHERRQILCIIHDIATIHTCNYSIEMRFSLIFFRSAFSTPNLNLRSVYHGLQSFKIITLIKPKISSSFFTKTCHHLYFSNMACLDKVGSIFGKITVIISSVMVIEEAHLVKLAYICLNDSPFQTDSPNILYVYVMFENCLSFESDDFVIYSILLCITKRNLLCAYSIQEQFHQM